MIKRRLLLTAAATTFGTASLPTRGRAEPEWPNKPLRFVVGFSAGSTPDLIARTIGDPLSQLLGQPVVVENKPGASGNIAADIVAKARDDHTVGVMINLNLTVARILNPTVTYDPAHRPRAHLPGRHDAFPVGDQPEMDGAESRHRPAPGRRQQAELRSVGIGSMAHLGMELLCARLGIKPTHIPYPGNPQVLQAHSANEIDLAFVPAGIAMQQVNGGKIGALAVASAKPSDLAPGVPTLSTLGVKDVEIEGWVAVAVAAAMAEAHRKKLETQVLKVLGLPEVRKQLTQQGWDVAAMPSDALARRLETRPGCFRRSSRPRTFM